MTASPSRIDGPAFSYTGGKWRHAPWLLRHFPAHQVYVEPFCGAASVLLRKAPSSLEVLNDLNRDIINFFAVLRSRPLELIHALASTPWSREEFRSARESLRRTNEAALEPLEQARLFAVLASQSFGGCAHSWSADRLKQDTGHRLWLRQAARLYAIAARLAEVQLECLPAEEVIRKYDQPAALLYIDPPYVSQTRTPNCYRHEMNDAAHEQLLGLLCSARGAVLVSGYDCALYRRMLRKWKRRSLQTDSPTSRGRTSKTARVEVLWFKPARTS